MQEERFCFQDQARTNQLSQRQTVVVLIDFVDGRYAIEMGQHDGLTGLSSPVVRQRTLGNGQRVAATAAQMIQTIW